MEDRERKQFGVAITAMLVTFGQEATTPRLLGYWMGLKDLPLADVETAVGRAIQKSSRLPVPADLRAIATGAVAGARALAAWADVQKAIPLGSYRSVNFRDPLINAAIRLLGGWPTMFERTADAEGEKWYRIEFTKTYETLAMSGVDGEVCRPLVGISEVTIAGGQKVPPVAIGCDPARRKLSTEVVRGAISPQASRKRIEIPKVEFKHA